VHTPAIWPYRNLQHASLEAVRIEVVATPFLTVLLTIAADDKVQVTPAISPPNLETNLNS
jgi:hypothetical protein